MARLNDVSSEGLKELAGYLKQFPPDDEEAEQYWYQLACVLRKKYRNRFDYTEQVVTYLLSFYPASLFSFFSSSWL